MNKLVSYHKNMAFVGVDGQLVARLVGAFLFIAAILKATNFGIHYSLLSSNHMTAVVTCELIIALWLISGVNRVFSHYSSIVLFFVFCIVNSYHVYIGNSKCNCLGRIEKSPLMLLIVDTTILISLLLTIPNKIAYSSTTNTIKYPVYGITAILLISSSFFIYNSNFNYFISYIRGNNIFILPMSVDVGVVSQNQSTSIQISVRNHSERNITLLGCSTSSSVYLIKVLPKTMPGNSDIILEYNFVAKGTEGHFLQTYHIYTDDIINPLVTGYISGTITEKNTQSR